MMEPNRIKKIILSGLYETRELEYSFAKRNEIINAALDQDLQITMYKLEDSLVIYTDNRKFR